MGSRKKQMADAIKEGKKQLAFAKLNNCPTSPRNVTKKNAFSSRFSKR